MRKIIVVVGAMFLGYLPNAYAINYVGFTTYLTKMTFPMGATYGGDVLLSIDTAFTPASSRTFNSGQVCDGLWLPKSDAGTNNAISAAFFAISTAKQVKVSAQDDKWPGYASFYCMVYSVDVIN